MDEVAVATDVLNAHSRSLHGVDDCTPDEIEEVWRAPEVEFPADVFLVESDGRIVGYADVIPFGETSWVDVRATDADVYDPLLEAATRRAAEQEKRHIRAFTGDVDVDAKAALERAGYRPIRYGFRMVIELDRELPDPQWPDGFVVRPYREGDAEHFHRLHQESFADTWEFTSEPFEPWAHWFMGSAFQPEHWFVVETEGEPAAIAICRISETEPDSGWVRILGVVPARRRRGLALALLQHLFRHFADQGMTRVQLGVDGENPTGAVALYERAGMSILRRNVTYERVSG
jgi:ribosomal protein S18 acetylase RimI-like enzyme